MKKPEFKLLSLNALFIITLFLISFIPETALPQKFNLDQTLSDGAQRTTIAFDALAFFTGSLGADSFFPPGKVADFWGFQYLRDNDPSEMGHNTNFLTKAAYNMLSILNTSQFNELKELARKQVESINNYGYDRFVLMKAFRRLLEGTVPDGKPQLDKAAVKAYSAQLYILDGKISYERAKVMGNIIKMLSTEQKAYLDALKGKGMLEWPMPAEPEAMKGLIRDEKVNVMTYAGDIFSWYLGSIDADIYFCPERQGTYFGSFYLKDAPAVGNPNYTIGSNLTADYGNNLLNTLIPSESQKIRDLVNIQKPFLLAIVAKRNEVSVQLRKFITGQTADSNTVINLMREYGELDGEIVYNFAVTFAQVFKNLTTDQKTVFANYRKEIIGTLSPSGAYLYATSIGMPDIPSTDFLFTGSVAIGNLSDNLPNSFTLYQNYPNPFNPSTKIKFSLPKGGRARVSVFDALGREVALLLDNEISAGSHEVSFNAGNLSSGIYFYVLKSGSVNLVKKMMLLK